MENILKMSEGGTSEYCCNVIQVPEIKPIEGSDFLGYAMINGLTVVVRKDQIHEGNVLFYVANECQISGEFLSANNLYSSSCHELNSNGKEVDKLLKEGQDIKKYCGFFEKNGRVRAIKLKGVKSYGFIFSKKEMAAYCPKTEELNLTEYINKDFDTVGGKLFVQAYIPKTNKRGGGNSGKAPQKKSYDIDCIIPNEFLLHYTTDPVGKNMFKFKPDTVVTISVKLHGTSMCYGNVLSKIPIKLPVGKRLMNLFIKLTGLCRSKKSDNFRVGYQDIYSSRTVIKNKYLSVKTPDVFSEDIWGEYHKLLEGKIPQGMTLYGEIIGVVDNTYIQDGYDYNCQTTNKLMIYRISVKDEITNERKEFSVREVYDWTLKFMEENPDLKERIHPIDILYHGTLQELYPELDTTSEHWCDDVLEAMKNDKKTLGMEGMEPLCTHKVPREGVVIRIDGDPLCEAFKLKCDKFMDKEREAIDKGVADMEMTS